MPDESGWYLSKAQVAERLGISQRTVERLTREGFLPHYRLGHRLLRYRWQDVEKVLERLRVGGT